jgi:hypothetical protein
MSIPRGFRAENKGEGELPGNSSEPGIVLTIVHEQ